MLCYPGLIFGGTGGVGCGFLVLRPQTSFRRCRGRRVPFSCFALPDSFSALPRVSRFHVLHPLTRFRRYRGRRFPISCFAPQESFSAVPRASGTVFMFCAPGLIFDVTGGVGSYFLVLRSRTHFRRYLGSKVPFSRFALPDSFSAVPGASGPVFKFSTPGFIFSGTESVGSRFHVLRSRTHFCGTEGVWSRLHVLRARTHFWRYRGRRVRFSYFARPDSFSTVPWASSPPFVFCVPGHLFDVTVGVGSRFHILRAQIRFLRCRVRRVSFSCFARPDSFSAVPGASGVVFLFSAPGLVFGGAGGVRSIFHVLLSLIRVRLNQGCPVFLFCTLRLVFGGTGGVVSRFHVLRPQTRFRRYRGRRVPFSCFALPESFSAVLRASKTRIHVLRFRTRFR
jgi:hypothetical protein